MILKDRIQHDLLPHDTSLGDIVWYGMVSYIGMGSSKKHFRSASSV